MANLKDYSVALFCPLVIEQQAACLMLDDVHERMIERSLRQNVLYTLGRIGSYNVAIVGYPAGDVGLGITGRLVSEVMRDFPNIEFGILLGVCTGIPASDEEMSLGLRRLAGYFACCLNCRRFPLRTQAKRACYCSARVFY